MCKQAASSPVEMCVCAEETGEQGAGGNFHLGQGQCSWAPPRGHHPALLAPVFVSHVDTESMLMEQNIP